MKRMFIVSYLFDTVEWGQPQRCLITFSLFALLFMMLLHIYYIHELTKDSAKSVPRLRVFWSTANLFAVTSICVGFGKPYSTFFLDLAAHSYVYVSSRCLLHNIMTGRNNYCGRLSCSTQSGSISTLVIKMLLISRTTTRTNSYSDASVSSLSTIEKTNSYHQYFIDRQMGIDHCFLHYYVYRVCGVSVCCISIV